MLTDVRVLTCTCTQMVTELDPGAATSQKLLFLTNRQADMIRSSEQGVDRLLDAFEMPMPKLIIRLQTSCGGVTMYEAMNPEHKKEGAEWTKHWDPTAGWSPRRPTPPDRPDCPCIATAAGARV